MNEHAYFAVCGIWFVDQVQLEGPLAGKKHRRQARGLAVRQPQPPQWAVEQSRDLSGCYVSVLLFDWRGV
eukprot:5819003-Lingulodinium_polyedra.AAC.1